MKAYSWSHMAGWYSEMGCEQFFQALWRDASVAHALESRLKSFDADQVLADIEQPA